jgi:endonuclease/exonuclease/phosphatase family metal-dependent hydrolase
VAVTLKVVSYNLHKGRSFFLRNRIWEQLADLIINVDPDIVFLQEFYRESQAEKMLERLADQLWPYHAYGQNAFAGDYHYGNAILSKFPMESVKNIDISTHRWEQRGALYAKIKAADTTNVHLFCTHFDLSSWGRRLQAQKLNAFIEAQTLQEDLVLLGGDFNDWDQKLNDYFSQIGLEDSYLKINGFHAKTCPGFFPVLALDRIFFRGLILKNAAVINHANWLRMTDHLPVTADFNFKK